MVESLDGVVLAALGTRLNILLHNVMKKAECPSHRKKLIIALGALQLENYVYVRI